MSLNSSIATLSEVVAYYSDKVRQFGPTPQGVDWNSVEGQELRFTQLAGLLPLRTDTEVQILDFGCGYGAFFDFLEKNLPDLKFKGTGFDLSPQMIQTARQTRPQHEWVTELPVDRSFDFVFASGVFNVRLKCPQDDWEKYVLESLNDLNARSRSGFAFNLLTTYSDVEKRASHLYFANPGFIFDWCKTKYSRFVTLKHDYPLYEFTIWVRK